METFIALLRAINLAGRKPVSMADLRDLASRLGCADARTLLQTGNLIFRRKRQAAAAIERQLEAAASETLGLDTEFFVRTADEWTTIVAGNPFPAEAKSDPAHLVLLLLKDAVDGKRVAALQTAIRDREVVRGAGRQIYAVYPDGIGRSRLTVALIERTLGTRATGRNWNTVLRAAHMITAVPVTP